MNYETLFEFERRLAAFTGAPYAVVTDGCTHALELCFRFDEIKNTRFTAYTYISIAQMLNQLGVVYELSTEHWIGDYQFYNTRIIDSARLLRRGMYKPGKLQCLSFGNGKPLSIGKMGAVLTDNDQVYQALSLMRSDGRDLRISPWESQTNFRQGYHYCPTLEDCQRGIDLLETTDQNPKYHDYPDLRTINFGQHLHPRGIEPDILGGVLDI